MRYFSALAEMKKIAFPFKYRNIQDVNSAIDTHIMSWLTMVRVRLFFKLKTTICLFV